MRMRLPAAPILFAGQRKIQRSGLCTFSVPMEKEGKTYYHYDHGDACRSSRWTARESFQFMYGRPWQEVVNFYFNLVNGGCSLMDLFGTRTDLDFARDDDDDDATAASEEETVSVPSKDKSGRFSRVTFKILLSYHGPSFDGWQKQPGLNTVQGSVETSLGKFIDEKKAELLKQKDKPLEGCAVVAGRTDKGVSALQQVCSFYTWRKDVIPGDIEDAINNVAPGKLRIISVSKVSRVFHPNFSAKWRRYLYIFPVTGGENIDRGFQTDEDFADFSSEQTYNGETHEFVELKSEENFGNSIPSDGCEDGPVQKPRSFSICKVNKMLQQLEGKLLSFKIFARDTKASRNIGPPTECFIYHARAAAARLPCSDTGEGRTVMCVELVANRFLRKMVRVLVATSVREAAAGAPEDALLKLMDASCRRATAPPAPPEGLCLVNVGYDEFDPKTCLIP